MCSRKLAQLEAATSEWPSSQRTRTYAFHGSELNKVVTRTHLFSQNNLSEKLPASLHRAPSNLISNYHVPVILKKKLDRLINDYSYMDFYFKFDVINVFLYLWRIYY